MLQKIAAEFFFKNVSAEVILFSHFNKPYIFYFLLVICYKIFQSSFLQEYEL